jgi:hypothetical protein
MEYTFKELADTVSVSKKLFQVVQKHTTLTHGNSQIISYLEVKYFMEQTAICKKMLHICQNMLHLQYVCEHRKTKT